MSSGAPDVELAPDSLARQDFNRASGEDHHIVDQNVQRVRDAVRPALTASALVITQTVRQTRAPEAPLRIWTSVADIAVPKTTRS
jgi:hypothetical protein